jgi:Ca2+-binding EF-hand superfamily protein
MFFCFAHVEPFARLIDSILDSSSFPTLLQELQLTLTDSELVNMIKDASSSGKQHVTEHEYLHILKNSTWI